jgi:hypothetical protein
MVACVSESIQLLKSIHLKLSHGGGGTGKNVENHVRENIGWILFKTHNFYIFLRYTIASSKCKFGNYI